jgi:hypothetical protein
MFLYYVRTGSVDTRQLASSHKQAAIKTLKNCSDFGKFVIVGTNDIDDATTSGSQMFFSTSALLEDCESDDNNMKLVY